MPEVVAMESGPQGRASDSWDILAQQPSLPELGERTKEPEPPATEEPAKELPEQAAPVEAEVPKSNGQDEQQHEPQDRALEKEKGQKLSRYERTKRQRAALEAREKAISERERAFAESERERNKPPYTLAELKHYRKAWEKEGNYDLVEKADAEIGRLEQLEAQQREIVEVPKSGTEQFRQQWESAEQELYKLDPEFQRQGTRLDKVLRDMMNGPDGPAYRQHPRGIVAAYHRAKLAITEADLGSARSENQKLRNELARLTGLTSIGGSGGAGRGLGEMRGKEFANMTTREMRDYLKRNAARGKW